MTNEAINDYLKDIYTVFKRHRGKRPITDEEKEYIWDEMDAVTDKYAVYRTENPADGFANEDIYKVTKWLFNELERAET